MRRALIGIALLTLGGNAAADTVFDTLAKDLASAQAYAAGCSGFQFGPAAKGGIDTLLQAVVDDPSFSAKWLDAARVEFEQLTLQKLGDVCTQANEKFGDNGSVRQGWLVANAINISLHGMMAGLDTLPPSDPKREIMSSFMIISRAEQRCPNYKITDEAYLYSAKMRFRQTNPGGELSASFQSEIMKLHRWLVSNTGRLDDHEWLCKEAYALYGPDGTLHKGFLVKTSP